MIAFACLPGAAGAAGVPGQGTWEATLQPRDLDGNLATAEAYYQTDVDITWLDANESSDFPTMSAWVDSLDPYGSGVTGWRLPRTVDYGNDGCTYTNYYQGVDCGFNFSVFSELGHMFYVTLGNDP